VTYGNFLEVKDNHAVIYMMIINGCIGNAMHIATFGTIFNWCNREEAFKGISLFFLSLIPILIAAESTLKSEWT